MPDGLEQEVMQIFKELSPDTQNTMLMYARVARIAENAVKESTKTPNNVRGLKRTKRRD
jgi:hypothetical protein